MSSILIIWNHFTLKHNTIQLTTTTISDIKETLNSDDGQRCNRYHKNEKLPLFSIHRTQKNNDILRWKSRLVTPIPKYAQKLRIKSYILLRFEKTHINAFILLQLSKTLSHLRFVSTITINNTRNNTSRRHLQRVTHNKLIYRNNLQRIISWNSNL